MIHFKSHKYGFTLIEVMIAMAVAALVLTPLFMLYRVMLNNVNRDSYKFNAMLLAKQVMIEAAQKKQPETRESSFVKNFEHTPFSAQYTIEKVQDKKSSLFSIENMYKEMVVINWTDINNQKRSEKLIIFFYKPEQKEQKKK